VTPTEAALRMLLEPGATVELRVPKAGRARVISGYFDDPQEMARTVAQLDGRHPGIYFTCNPVKPALLARASNRVVEHAELTTSDHDVARRRWLPIDLDPVRPAGICATDPEHQAALDKAQQIADFLVEQGWPAPVLVDSGNGAYVLALVDLPNDEGSRDLLHRCLGALARRFDDPAVQVDTTMANAARIIRVPAPATPKATRPPTDLTGPPRSWRCPTSSRSSPSSGSEYWRPPCRYRSRPAGMAEAAASRPASST
jgi:hypothetical protein